MRAFLVSVVGAKGGWSLLYWRFERPYGLDTYC